MIIDTSALVAIVRDEPEKGLFFSRIIEAQRSGEPIRMSAATLVELTTVIDRYRDARASELLDVLLAELALEIVPFDADLGLVARRANRRFGKGFHPARLNLGDCFSYALSKATNEPLLFKGKDFPQTDVQAAV